MTSALPFRARVNAGASFSMTANGDGEVQKSAKGLASPIRDSGDTESEKRPDVRYSCQRRARTSKSSRSVGEGEKSPKKAVSSREVKVLRKSVGRTSETNHGIVLGLTLYQPNRITVPEGYSTGKRLGKHTACM